MSHKYSSWGRTRRPKAISGSGSFAVIPSGSLEVIRPVATVSTFATLDNTLQSTTEGEIGYTTENQRYLHVTVSGNADGSVQVAGYNYAVQIWSSLHLPNPVSGSDIFDDSPEWGLGAFAACGDGGQPATFVFEIAGTDRVAFVTGSDGAPSGTFAACSTF
jgi:hypothetical protein